MTTMLCEIEFPINKIELEYLPDNSIWSEEDAKINSIKNRIFNRLDITDRRILILYAELNSLRKVSKILHVSPTTLLYRLNKIRNILKS